MKLKRWLFLFVIVIGIGYVMKSNNPNPNPSKPTNASINQPTAKPAPKKINRKCTDEVYAYNITKELVKSQLKAPASAKFASIFREDHVTVLPDKNCSFIIRAHVDSQNSFGALMRLNFSAKVKYHEKTSKWSLIEFQQLTQ